MSETVPNRNVLFGRRSLMTMSGDDSLSNQPPNCRACGKATSLLYSFVDPTSARRIRTYKCSCGEQMVVPVTQPDKTEQ
jgi:hypothetical protein